MASTGRKRKSWVSEPLLKKAQNGDTKALSKIISQNQFLIPKFVLKKYWIDSIELTSLCWTALEKAVLGYDPTKGAFSTYAMWQMESAGCTYKAIRQSEAVHIPVSVKKKMRKESEELKKEIASMTRIKEADILLAYDDMFNSKKIDIDTCSDYNYSDEQSPITLTLPSEYVAYNLDSDDEIDSEKRVALLVPFLKQVTPKKIHSLIEVFFETGGEGLDACGKSTVKRYIKPYEEAIRYFLEDL